MNSQRINLLLALALICIAATADEPYTQTQIVEKMVGSFGLDQWHKIEAIRFTFNVQKEDQRKFRTWEWSPRTNIVTYSGPVGEQKLATIRYDRDTLNDKSSPQVREVDAMFINDSYWLLMPLHLSWSKDVKLEYTGYQNTPLKKSIAQQVIVSYPAAAGGYTPGDMYRLYLDDTWRIVQWTYHKAGAIEPTLATIWAQDEQVGPLRLTTDFINNDAKFHLWFTGVAVKTAESDDWIASQRIDHKCRTCP